MSLTNNSKNKCPKCKRVKEEARLMPCGVYCLECSDLILKSVKISSNNYWCLVCQENHLIPKNGFQNCYFKKLDPIDKEFEQFKSNLSKINSVLKMFKFQIENCEDQIKESCVKLRNEIQLETELLIKKVQDLSEVKIRQVDDYEQKCLSIDKSKIKFGFIEEMEKFLASGKVHLEDRSKEDFEIQRSNELSETILSRIEEEKAKLDLLIFSGSVMEFRKSPNELNEEILGNFDFRKSIKSKFSSMKSQNVHVASIFPNMNDEKSIKFEYIVNENFAAAFVDKDSRLNFVLLNKDLTIFQDWKSLDKTVKMFDYSSNKNNIILCYVQGEHAYQDKIKLLIFDFELTVLKIKEFSMDIYFDQRLNVSSNDSNICLLFKNRTDFSRPLKIFDMALNCIKEVGQSDFPTGLYYLSNKSECSVHLIQSKMYVLNSRWLDVLNFETGKKIKSVYLNSKTDKIRTDLNRNFYFYFKPEFESDYEIESENESENESASKSENKIARYNRELIFLEDIKVKENARDFVVDKDGNFKFF